MIRPCDNEFILWDGQVYQRIGTPTEAGISTGRFEDAEPSGYIATEPVSVGARVFAPGEELPAGQVAFPRGAQRFDISVAIVRGFDPERLVKRGLAKRKRGRRRA